MATNLGPTKREVSPNAATSTRDVLPKASILYVEDDPDICDMASLMLSREGYEIVCTGSCNEALESAQAETFDLYIVDNTLRDGSGFDLCQQLRALDKSASILVCSGWPEDEYWALALECGAKGYLTKPFAPDQLLSEITRLLSQRG